MSTCNNFTRNPLSELNAEEYELTSTVTYEDVTPNEEMPDSTFELDLPDNVADLRNNDGPSISEYDTYDAVVSNTDLSVPPADLTERFSFDSASAFEDGDINSVSVVYTNGEENVTVVVHAEPIAAVDYSEPDRFESVGIGDTTEYVENTEDFVSLYVEGDQPYTIHGQIDEKTAVDIADAVIDDE